METPEELAQRRENYLRKQKQKLAVTIIMLLACAMLTLTWKIYSEDQKKEEAKSRLRSDQVSAIQNSIEQTATSDGGQGVSTTASRQQSIVDAIRSSQPLPVRIDEITVISDVYFRDNSLFFEITVSTADMKPDMLEKMKDAAAVSGLLLKNKPVACNLMQNISTWEGDWTVTYLYYLSEPRQQIGSAVFEPSRC